MIRSACLIIIFLFLFTLPDPVIASDSERLVRQRKIMVEKQIRSRKITDRAVLNAMETVPRHLFVPENLINRAYEDGPLPIGEGQTISQPYIVALMTELLHLSADSRVLEIGTGSGYQAAVLAQITANVYSVEIKEKLHLTATAVLKKLGIHSVKTRHGDGYFGWQNGALFDGIMITAAVDHIPPPLLRQLKDGGRLVLPLGNPFSFQNLVVVKKKGSDYTVRQVIGVLFVPMTGHALDRDK